MNASVKPETAAANPFLPGTLRDGGELVGIRKEGEGFCAVIRAVGPEAETVLPWREAMDWAAGLTIGGFTDWRLPTRDDLRLMKASGLDFKKDWYWSSEEFGTGPAWFQGFDGGFQYSYGKLNDVRCRAVRKVLI